MTALEIWGAYACDLLTHYIWNVVVHSLWTHRTCAVEPVILLLF